MTHCSWLLEALRSRGMAGAPTLTMVESSRSMTSAPRTVSRTNHLSLDGRGPGGFSPTVSGAEVRLASTGGSAVAGISTPREVDEQCLCIWNSVLQAYGVRV